MRILVTGGAGFIGVHLANRLHAEGRLVRVLDNLSSGDPALLDPGINLTRGDVRDVPKLWSLLQGAIGFLPPREVGGEPARNLKRRKPHRRRLHGDRAAQPEEGGGQHRAIEHAAKRLPAPCRVGYPAGEQMPAHAVPQRQPLAAGERTPRPGREVIKV